MSEACSLMKNVSMQCLMAWMPATRSSARCAESKKALSTGAKVSTLLQQFVLRNRQTAVGKQAAVGVNFNKTEKRAMFWLFRCSLYALSRNTLTVSCHSIFCQCGLYILTRVSCAGSDVLSLLQRGSFK